MHQQSPVEEWFRYCGGGEHEWRLQVRHLAMEVVVSLRQVEQRVAKPKSTLLLRGMREKAIQIGGDLWVPDHFVMLFLLLETDLEGIGGLQQAVTAARTQALQYMRTRCQNQRLDAEQLLQKVEDRLARAGRRPGTGKRRR